MSHRRWSADGTWDRILQAVHADADLAGRIDWSMVGVDSTSTRAHQHAAGVRKQGPHVPKKRTTPRHHRQITGEDLTAISPYLTDHIMRFGTYATTELTARPDAFDPHLDVEFEAEEEVPAAASAPDDFLGRPDAVQAAGVPAEPEDLVGAGEQSLVGGSGADRAVLDPAWPRSSSIAVLRGNPWSGPSRRRWAAARVRAPGP